MSYYYPNNNYPRRRNSYPRTYSNYPRRNNSYPRTYGNYPRRSNSYPRAYGNYPRRSNSYPRTYGNYPRRRYNPYKQFLAHTLNFTSRHPKIAQQLYNDLGRQQGFQMAPRQRMSMNRPAPQTQGQAPASNRHPGYNKDHPYYANLYVSKAWVNQNPRTHKPIVYVVARRRRDINPNAKYAGADVFNHQGKDGSVYHDQPFTTTSFNKIRQANNLEPLSDQEYMQHNNGRLFATSADKLGFDAHIFKNTTRNRQPYQNPFLISVNSIKKTSVPFDPKREAQLDNEAKQQRQQQQQSQQQQGAQNNAPQNGQPSGPQAPAGNAPQGNGNDPFANNTNQGKTTNRNPFSVKPNQPSDDGPEA